MYSINWDKFNVKNPDKANAFENMCRHLFMRKYKVSGYDFQENYNNTGLETEPIKFQGKYYGFQCKYYTSSSAMYAAVRKSLKKAFEIYDDKLDEVYIYTHLNIQPHSSAEKLEIKSNKSDRVEIQRLEDKHNCKINWVTESKFEAILNETENLDLYRLYFAKQDELKFIGDQISSNDRTFLSSSLFLDLPVNGNSFSKITSAINCQKTALLTGSAGTGKTELMKKLFVETSLSYLNNYKLIDVKNVKSVTTHPIPIFVRLREIVNGNLESLLRDRLLDYGIKSKEKGQNFSYYFDGLDEIDTQDIYNIVYYIKNLLEDDSTSSIIISSRPATHNIISLEELIAPTRFRIESLDKKYIFNYFKLKNDADKLSLLEKQSKDLDNLLNRINDILSIHLLWENFNRVSSDMTTIDLIDLSVTTILQRTHNKHHLNLPEEKALALSNILETIAYTMQLYRRLRIDTSEIQEIIEELFPKLSYKEINSIINCISSMFFDSLGNSVYQRAYSFSHRRFQEYFLYKSISKMFYDDAFVLRELNLLPNKDFILNIFLSQELKNTYYNKKLLDNLTLRFFEAYLGTDYLKDLDCAFKCEHSRFSTGTDGYLESDTFMDYLALHTEEQLFSLIDNNEYSIHMFLKEDTYWKFVKKYLEFNGVDIRSVLDKRYGNGDDFLRDAATKNINSYFYWALASGVKKLSEIIVQFEDVEFKNLVFELDFLHSMSDKNLLTIIEVFEYGLYYLQEELKNLISDFSKYLLEILCYVLLRVHNSYALFAQTSSELRDIICTVIKQNECSDIQLNCTVFYNLFSTDKINIELLEKRFAEKNISNYGTWERNLEANSYIAIIIKKTDSVCQSAYRLGIDIRELLLSSQNQAIRLDILLERIKQYNLIYDNWFSYNNSCLIGSLISTYNLDLADLKDFISNLKKYESVISITTILYTVLQKNKELFLLIANASLIEELCLNYQEALTYYDFDADYYFVMAIIMRQFDINKSEKYFLKGINNVIFRPTFRKEDLIKYILPVSVKIAFQNSWCKIHYIKNYISRIHSMLLCINETTDHGANWNELENLIKCIDSDWNLLDEIYMHTSNYVSHLPANQSTECSPKCIDTEIIDISNLDLEKAYKCELDELNYNSFNTWEKIISYEQSIDPNLTILFRILKQYYFPRPDSGGIGKYFDFITAILYRNSETQELIQNFIFEQGGRDGLYNMIRTYATLGDAQNGRLYLERLFIMSEVLVFPNKNYYLLNSYNPRIEEEVIEKIHNSTPAHWISTSEDIRIFKENAEVRIIKDDDFDDRQKYTEGWATRFPDKIAYELNYNIYYRNEIIDSFILVGVDGYRAYMPPPRLNTNSIPRYLYNLALLFNDKKNLHSYIARSGFIVE